jgi:hypothetical protein
LLQENEQETLGYALHVTEHMLALLDTLDLLGNN